MEMRRGWCGGDGLGEELKLKQTVYTCEKAEECREQYKQSDNQQKKWFEFQSKPIKVRCQKVAVTKSRKVD